MRAHRLSAMALASAFLCAACNAILGNTDRKLYEGDASTDASAGGGDALPPDTGAADGPAGGPDGPVTADAPAGDAPLLGDGPAGRDGATDARDGDGACGDTTTDSLNCGACGHSCLGAACAGGLCVPTVLASSITPPEAIFVDPTTVWWLGGAYLYSCSIQGCSNTPDIQAQSQLGPSFWLAQLGNDFFFAAGNTLADGGTVADIERWTKYSLTRPAAIASAYSPRSLVACGASVCWIDTPANSTLGTVYACPPAGCATPAVITSDQYANEVTSDGQNVYIATLAAIDACAVGGCAAPTQVIATPGAAQYVAVGNGYLAWDEHEDSVRACKLSDCPGTVTTLVTGVTWPHGVVVDGTTVYFTTYEAGGSLLACDVGGCGGTPRTLAKSQPTPEHVAVDATRVYFSTDGLPANGNGQLLWVAK